jgi:hypothetical protein
MPEPLAALDRDPRLISFLQPATIRPAQTTIP